MCPKRISVAAGFPKKVSDLKETVAGTRQELNQFPAAIRLPKQDWVKKIETLEGKIDGLYALAFQAPENQLKDAISELSSEAATLRYDIWNAAVEEIDAKVKHVLRGLPSKDKPQLIPLCRQASESMSAAKQLYEHSQVREATDKLRESIEGFQMALDLSLGISTENWAGRAGRTLLLFTPILVSMFISRWIPINFILATAFVMAALAYYFYSKTFSRFGIIRHIGFGAFVILAILSALGPLFAPYIFSLDFTLLLSSLSNPGTALLLLTFVFAVAGAMPSVISGLPRFVNLRAPIGVAFPILEFKRRPQQQSFVINISNRTRKSLLNVAIKITGFGVELKANPDRIPILAPEQPQRVEVELKLPSAAPEGKYPLQLAVKCYKGTTPKTTVFEKRITLS